MSVVPATAVDRVPAPPLAPIEEAIDLSHLARMTLGDTSLEREVLQLFDRQAEMLLARMRADPAHASGHAHTLKGSSSGIGAWKVASAAEAVGAAAAAGGADLVTAIERLGHAIDEARAFIAELLRHGYDAQT